MTKPNCVNDCPADWFPDEFNDNFWYCRRPQGHLVDWDDEWEYCPYCGRQAKIVEEK